MSATEFEPYRPPEAELMPHVHSVPLKPMYSAEQILLASFFGTPILGYWLLGTNYARLGRDLARWICVGLGSLVTVAAYTLEYQLTVDKPSMNTVSAAILLGHVLLMFPLARFLQADDYIQHLKKGGGRYSYIRVLLITAAVWISIRVVGPEIFAFGRDFVRGFAAGL